MRTQTREHDEREMLCMRELGAAQFLLLVGFGVTADV